ncbi:hypothetical protein GUITHDRAFT_138210 [Guillardia theta CCMP2712]|uniref:Cyclin N-terminal domain-containing protein n=1 Tax=Guillardia theta (strain CCMP2712) TaxID=905079 RepID=L1JD80_GUITC|nr:hypothetical protein GUITHDRAFT_138210 [Guillardia theta CCMP2712]EKX46466.1 hypothetical protein GUITHDRAFT_138210 [Guillardia theta CCMP2712]|eukprot:XP_005833446.1 hypothetical protein GUITHDRAFT_138210 [Guillardia theta CCMP2712]
MTTMSWLDPQTRQARLLTKKHLQEMHRTVHGMDQNKVDMYRWHGCDLIDRMSEGLNMFRPARACACVLFNRFYARNGFNATKPASWDDADWYGFLPARFKNLDWRFVAISCLFLAGKIEDNPKKIAAVIKCLREDRNATADLLENSNDLMLRDTILAYERLVLQMIEFDMIVEAPVAYNQVAYCVRLFCGTELPKQSQEEDSVFELSEHGEEILDIAVRFVHNSLYTTLWLEYDAPTIAIGDLYFVDCAWFG